MKRSICSISEGEVIIPLTSLALEALADLLLSEGFGLTLAEAEAVGVADPVATGDLAGPKGILIIPLLEGPGKDSQAIDKNPVLSAIK